MNLSILEEQWGLLDLFASFKSVFSFLLHYYLILLHPYLVTIATEITESCSEFSQKSWNTMEY